MKKVIIIGGGGHASSVLEIACASGDLAGYADVCPRDSMPIGYLGTDEQVLSAFSPRDYSVHVAVGFTSGASLALRRAIIERYRAYEACTFVASSAVVTDGASIGSGCAIMHRAVVNKAKVGDFSVINTGAIVEHDCHIGSNVFVAPGAILNGGVTVADDVFIGAGAVIRQGVVLGPGVVVAMGAVVTADMTCPGVYAGMPAKKLK